MIWAYEYIKKNGGIDTEASYPYEAHRSICRYKRKNSVTSIASFTKLKKGSEMELKQAVATVGPSKFQCHFTKKNGNLFFKFHE